MVRGWGKRGVGTFVYFIIDDIFFGGESTSMRAGGKLEVVWSSGGCFVLGRRDMKELLQFMQLFLAM